MENPRRVLGIMSGTSLDGIDVALIDVLSEIGSNRLNYQLIAFKTFSFPASIRKRLLAVSEEGGGTTAEISELNFALGYLYSNCARKLIKEAGLTPEDIDLLGCHGQTIQHLPQQKIPSTLQIGEPGIIAQELGIRTISNFRARDMAAGGEGAPIVPYVDFLLFGRAEENVILQNIGGIGNFTYIPAGGSLDCLLASDTGPGNILIDGAVQLITAGVEKMDKDGNKARQGKVQEHLLSKMLEHPFLQRELPRTTGREDFGRTVVDDYWNLFQASDLSSNDFIATLTAFTVESIYLTYSRFLLNKNRPLDRVIIAGGGSYNPVIMEGLQKKLDPISCVRYEDLGFNGEAKEAVAIAILAWTSYQGQPNNVPAATGARERVVLGDLTPGQKGW